MVDRSIMISPGPQPAYLKRFLMIQAMIVLLKTLIIEQQATRRTPGLDHPLR